MVWNVISKVGTYAYRGLKASPKLLFTENGAKALVNGVNSGIKASTSKTLGGTLFNGLKTGGKALEGSVKGGLLNSIKYTATTAIPKLTKAGWKLGLAKGGVWGGIKGAAKGLSKAIPGIGNILIAAASIPTIYGAFKDEGIVGGVKEIAKEGTKLGAGAIGAAIGSAFGPIGSAVGWIGGSLIAGLFTGKSHSEKKAEEEAQLAEAQAQQAAVQEQMSQMIYNQYGNIPDNNFYLVKNPYATGLNTMC
ncbi:MAG: hypothetical protein NC191_09960 [Muribaculaceae bacterium]|nr:hypothetical protein [Muribaculaceae bacterium]